MITMDRLSDILATLRERIALQIGTNLSSRSETPSQEDDPCPTCKGAGFLRYDVPPGDPRFGRITPCPTCGPERERARLARVAARISAECGLEPELRTRTFDSFEPYPGNEKALDAARRFVDHGIDLGAWLVIRGTETGTGKTHLLAAIANAAIARGIPTFYSYTTDLLDHLRQGYRRTADPDPDEEDLGGFDERWERVKTVRLLLLDDLGVQVTSPWVRERMDALFDARYRASRPTVITTNLSPAELAAISHRIFDRINRHEPAAIVEMRAIKYRLWKRHQSGVESES